MIMTGYRGKILRVNLSTGKITEEHLPEEKVLKKFIGGWGLGLYYYSKEYQPGRSIRDPKTPLIFMTGPLTGTDAVSSTNTTCVTLNAETGYTTARSHTHGGFGQHIKRAGYDGIIITGKSEKPVYLWINDGKVEIRDADNVWGLDTHDTEDAILKELGINDPREATVAAIGPAGENVCHNALIENDKHHSFSHSGTGAVMGAKKLKSIAVRGTKRVPVNNKDALREIASAWRKALVGSEMGKFWIIGGKDAAGRHTVYNYDKRESLITSNNFLKVSPPDWIEDIEDIAEIRKRTCPGCPLGCAYEVEILKGPYKGHVFTPSGGGENMEGTASMAGVHDTAGVYLLTDNNDRLGVESGSMGCAVGLAIECFEKGLLTLEDTGGIELRWGDEKLVKEMVRMAAYREGKLGQLLAMGAKRMANKIGGEAISMAAHVKGGSMSHHDWRASWGVFFGQIVSGLSGWPAPGVTQFTTEPDVGYTEFQDPLTPEGKPLASRKTGMLKFYNDCTGSCWNSLWGVPGSLSFTTRCISAATGWDFTPEEALEVGERCMNLERICNVRNGLTRGDDLDISARLLQPPTEGRAKGKSIAPYLEGMVDEYYELMGWNLKSGKPYRETLERLDLEEYISLIWE